MTFPYGSPIGPADFPCREGRHVSYDTPEWKAMVADAARLVPKDAAVDPCAEVAGNLAEMARDDALAARRQQVRATLDQIRANAVTESGVAYGWVVPGA